MEAFQHRGKIIDIVANVVKSPAHPKCHFATKGDAGLTSESNRPFIWADFEGTYDLNWASISVCLQRFIWWVIGPGPTVRIECFDGKRSAA